MLRVVATLLVLLVLATLTSPVVTGQIIPTPIHLPLIVVGPPPTGTLTPTATTTPSPTVTDMPTEFAPIATPTPTFTATNLPTATPTATSVPPTPTPTLPANGNQQEWIWHKSADGAHPSGLEQQMLWLMNRARANPAQEGIWLATTDEPDIAGGRTFFGVNTTLLMEEFASYEAKPPAAFDRRLYNAAYAHSLDMIARDSQDHQQQLERIAQAGFDCTWRGGNIFAYAESALHAHGSMAIDWGYGPDGMQPNRGHRMLILAISRNYTNFGAALVEELDPATSVGPLVTTANYCAADEGTPDHYNRFLVGTVWSDLDGDALYDPGEGIGNVRVFADRGEFYAITGAAGGYAIPMTETGSYQVYFVLDESAPDGIVVQEVTIGQESVLLDLQRDVD